MDKSIINSAGFEIELKALLLEVAPMHRYVDLLRQFRDTGATRDDARAVIEQLRQHNDISEREDQLLDLLDIVEGFVSPCWQVW